MKTPGKPGVFRTDGLAPDRCGRKSIKRSLPGRQQERGAHRELIVDCDARDVRPHVHFVVSREAHRRWRTEPGVAAGRTDQGRVEFRPSKINPDVFASYAPLRSELPFDAAAA